MDELSKGVNKQREEKRPGALPREEVKEIWR